MYNIIAFMIYEAYLDILILSFQENKLLLKTAKGNNTH